MLKRNIENKKKLLAHNIFEYTQYIINYILNITNITSNVHINSLLLKIITKLKLFYLKKALDKRIQESNI